MMACTSSPGCLYSAPFAMLGSIGVIGQTFNIHKTLEGWGVRPLVFRGGRDKAPVGLVGEVTEEGIRKVQDMVDKTHSAFKLHVAECRPSLASQMDDLAEGEVWLGQDALKVGLVDQIMTSDEYIGERMLGGARVLKLVQLIPPKYPFQTPKTSSSLMKADAPVLFSKVSDLWTLLEKARDALGSFVVEGDAGTRYLTRGMGVNDISSSS
jgi:ClpP class serine protease